MRTNLISTKEDVIAFWFAEISPEAWFKKDREFDELVQLEQVYSLEKH